LASSFRTWQDFAKAVDSSAV